MLLDIFVALCIMGIIYTLSWWLINTEREIRNPNFHKDNNKVAVYEPQKDYFDKLEFQDNDLLKAIEEGRQERLEQIFDTLIESKHFKKSTEKEYDFNPSPKSPESSPIPRHPNVYGAWSLSPIQIDRSSTPRS